MSFMTTEYQKSIIRMVIGIYGIEVPLLILYSFSPQRQSLCHMKQPYNP